MKKRIFCIFIIFICMITTIIPYSTAEAKRKWVHGYTRKDGTRVHGYYRNSGYDNTSSITPVTDNSINTKYNKKYVNLYKNLDLVGAENADKLVYVHGYYDKNGNYVRPHYRTYPNQFISDNFSYQGLSTLKPRPVSQKYNYVYSSNDDIKRIETYILHNIENEVGFLDGDKKKLIATYAEELKNNTATVELANNVYKTLGYDDIQSLIFSKYDINGNLTADFYLYNILYNYDIVLTSDLEWFFEYYAALLNVYSRNEVSIDKVINYARKFYKIMGLSINYIDNQIEMDLMQKLSYSDYTEYEEIVKNLLGINLSCYWDGNINNSLFETYISGSYNIDKFSSLGIYLSLYNIDMKFLTEQIYGNNLETVFCSGREFYKLLGLCDDDISKKIKQDVILYILN